MSFVHPMLALAAIAAVALPIIIHLMMQRRRRPIAFGAMRFLAEALRTQRQKLRLEQWLLLAVRCLLVLLAGLAIARPMLGDRSASSGQGRDVVLVLDTSLPSGAVDPASGVSSLQRQKDLGLETIERLSREGGGGGVRVGVVLAGAPARAVVEPMSADMVLVRRVIDAASATHAAADWEAALALARDMLEGGTKDSARSVVLLSDFYVGVMPQADDTGSGEARSAGVGGPLPPVEVWASSPATSGLSNVAIVSAVPLQRLVTGEPQERGGEAARAPIRVELRRFGPAVQSAGQTRLVAEDARAPGTSGELSGQEETVSWRPGESEAVAVVSASIRPERGVTHRRGSSVAVRVRATTVGDALSGDDEMFVAVEHRRGVRVGIVGAHARGGFSADRPADWIAAALAPTGADRELGEVEARIIEPAMLRALAAESLDAMVIASAPMLSGEDWGLVAQFAQSGGTVLITPGAGEGAQVWTDVAVEALGLPWKIGREAAAVGMSPSASLGLGADAGGILGMLGPEWEALARPVRVDRAVAIEAPPSDVVAMLEDGRPWIVARRLVASRVEGDGSAGRGVVVLLGSAISLDWTDLPARPMFVALLHQLVRDSIGMALASTTMAAGTVGGRDIRADGIELHAGATSGAGSGAGVSEASAMQPTVQGPGTRRVAFPLRSVWELASFGVEGGSVVIVNADARASSTEPTDPARAKEAIARWSGGGAAGPATIRWLGASGDGDEGGGEATIAGPSGVSIAIPLLAIAVGLAMFEPVLSRLFSHASVRRRRGGLVSTVPARV